MRTRNLSAFAFTAVFCAALLLLSRSGDSSVYRCTTSDGHMEFRDLPCIGGEAAEISSDPGVRLPALTLEERARAERLDAELQRRASERDRMRAAASRERASSEKRRRADCERAITELDALRSARRRGYSIAEDAELRRSEAKYRDLRQRSCHP